MIDKDRMSDIPTKSESRDGAQHDPKTRDDHEHKHSARGPQDDNIDGHWQKAEHPDLCPTDDTGSVNNSDMSDLHALLASMPAAEALDFAIDYLSADLSSDTACFHTADGSSHDDFA